MSENQLASGPAGSSRKRESQCRLSGKAYKTRKGILKPEKKEPAREPSCKCKFHCKRMNLEKRRLLFKKFYAENSKVQGTYLMGLIHLTRIKRRRHGSYENPTKSQRQTTVSYTLPDANNEFIRVCKKTFAETFCVSFKKLDVLVSKKKLGETCSTDKRTNHMKPKYSAFDRECIVKHVNSIPRQESHYGRAKSTQQYLSPDLNVNRLFKAFKKFYPNTDVTYKFYRSVFKREFPNLKFHHPRVDTCNLCDKLNCEMRANIESSSSAKIKLEIHHRKAEQAQHLLKQNFSSSQEIVSNVCVLSMDLEQVLFVPTLTHSDMFYLSQLSCYNFGVHIGDTGTAFMCLWHEGLAGRGSNEIASCLLSLLNEGVLTSKSNLIIWSDNCAGQNKNRVILFVLIFLVANGLFESIEQRFLVSGHSFMPCDRDFALIEKRKRVMKAMVPADLSEIIESAKYTPPFKVIDMEYTGFWDIKEAANTYLNTTNLKISKATVLRIEKNNPSTIYSKDSYSEVQPWTRTNILKKAQSLENLRRTELKKLPPTNKISDNKKKCLKTMIDFLPEERHKNFYRHLLQ